MRSTVLAVNSGSSSVKATLFSISADHTLGEQRYHLVAESQDGTVSLHVRGANLTEGRDFSYPRPPGDIHDALFEVLMHQLEQLGEAAPAAIGHRVAHGGPHYANAVEVDDVVLAALDRLVPLAPLHQPYCLGGIRALAKRFPLIPQVASFDTAFHATLPQVETRYALPSAMEDLGVRRYGFHGLSYSYIASVLPNYLGLAADSRVVVAHLGSGASLCAMHGRRSVATTMGFTALDGLVMGTRCGSLDPGVVLYLADEIGMSTHAISDILYHRSGLLGVSGISADMRTLLASKESAASEAVELFCYRLNRELGAMVAALGGIDALVFTGGIGEHAAEVRKRVTELAAWTGMVVDASLNDQHAARISAEDSKVDVVVIQTDEERVIAQAALMALH